MFALSIDIGVNICYIIITAREKRSSESGREYREGKQERDARAGTDLEVEAIKDAIKAAMGDAESVQAGEYKITWKAVTSARIDTGALRKALPDVAAAFTRETTVRRFCVA